MSFSAVDLSFEIIMLGFRQTLLLGKKEKKSKVEGYEEGVLSVHKKVDATTFIQAHVRAFTVMISVFNS